MGSRDIVNLLEVTQVNAIIGSESKISEEKGSSPLLSAVNYYHKELHLGCCSSPRSASGSIVDGSANGDSESLETYETSASKNRK